MNYLQSTVCKKWFKFTCSLTSTFDLEGYAHMVDHVVVHDETNALQQIDIVIKVNFDVWLIMWIYYPCRYIILEHVESSLYILLFL